MRDGATARVRVVIAIATISTAQLRRSKFHRACTLRLESCPLAQGHRSRPSSTSLLHRPRPQSTPPAINIHVVYEDSHYLRPHPCQPSPPLRHQLLSRSAKPQFNWIQLI